MKASPAQKKSADPLGRMFREAMRKAGFRPLSKREWNADPQTVRKDP